jgi:hypothetical protein
MLPFIGVVAAWMAALDETLGFLQRGRDKYFKAAEYFTLGVFSVFVAIVLAQYMRSNLAMNFSYRFYVPMYPMAILTLAWLLTPAFDAVRFHRKIRSWTYISVLVVLVFLSLTQVVCQMKWFVFKEIPFASQYETLISEMHRPAGKYLRARVPTTEWLVVHIDAGAIPFYSGLKTVDFGVLNDEYLAHHDLSIEERVDYFFSVDPGAVVFTSYDWEDVDHGPEADAIISDPRFENYTLVRKFDNSTGEDYFEFVFLRQDLVDQAKYNSLTLSYQYP